MEALEWALQSILLEDDIHIMYSRIKINENNPLDIAKLRVMGS